jgi:UDP-N-acetylglucosamine:LPS N-acetylglucosamine transferase
MLVERELTPAALWDEVLSLTADDARRGRMEAAARERARPHAAREIAERLHTLLGGRP